MHFSLHFEGISADVGEVRQVPTTTFTLRYEGTTLDVDRSLFQAMLPPSMQVVEQNGATTLAVQTTREEDAESQLQVDRELDRLFFLTGVRCKAEMHRRRVTAVFHFKVPVHGSIPAGTPPQTWTNILGLQFRLWALASEAEDPIFRILLLYQIVELSNPDSSVYPKYLDKSQPPHPLKECLLLRHLVAHAGDVRNPELLIYCEHLGVPAVMLDRTDERYVALLSSKARFVEEQARAVLHVAMQP